jgi:predicted transcriptional regulator
VPERTERVTVRLSPALVGRLDALAAGRGLSRSACLRALVAEGALPAAEAIPDEAELLSILAERARSGNVAAIRLLMDREAREPVSEFERMVNMRLRGGDRQ